MYEDQVRSIEGKGTTAPGQIDFALLTDGLRAEREQGITIDVAYRYFSTARRKFIIADTPGHEQYTRNMATGASTADVAVVLVDARKGVLVQSRRHAYIASLLGVRHVLVAVNKMDLIGLRRGAFHRIENGIQPAARAIAEDTGNAVNAVFVPVSALEGRQHCASLARPCRGTPGLRCWSCWSRCRRRKRRAACRFVSRAAGDSPGSEFPRLRWSDCLGSGSCG